MLRTLPNFEIHLGHFLTHTKALPLAHPVPGLPPIVTVIKTNEKGSDVNLATHLLHDGHCDRYDTAIVVSGDSDLLAPIRIVMEELGKTVGVLNPQKRPCRVLVKQSTFYRHIRQGILAVSQFPVHLSDTNGNFHKPPTW